MIAGVLFVLPGALTVLLLSMIYVTYQQSIAVASVFFGVKAAVLAIVTTALWRLARKVIRRRVLMVITAASFIASFVLAIPFPLVIIGAAMAALFSGISPAAEETDDSEGNSRAIDSRVATQAAPPRHRAFLVAMICGSLWLAPVAILYGWLGAGHIYVQQALFFSQVAVVTFGGAYAVLSYLAQQTVGHYGWVSAGEMLDGLGMAETTPGPLIMVTQFVGFIGAYRSPGVLDPMLAGTLGALVASWVTFAPCFLWIFLGAPYIEKLRGNAVLARVLSFITAAVVGVILNLAVWFGVQVLFTELRPVPIAFSAAQKGTVALPVLESFDLLVGAMMVTALLAITVFRIGMIKVLLCSAAFGLAAGKAGLM